MSDDTDIGRTPGEPAAVGPLSAWGITRLDDRALTEPVDRAAVRDYQRRSRQNGAAWAEGATARVLAVVLMVIIGLVVLGVAVVSLGVITDIGSASYPTLGEAGSTSLTISRVVSILLPGFLGAVAVFVAVRALRSGPHGRWARWYRLDRFAQSNGLIAEPLSPGLAYQGAIFGQGGARAGYDRIRSRSGRVLDLGNYRYTTGSGDNRTTHSWGYLALQLDRRLPHMLLDSRANNGMFGASNLPISVARNQQLRLEGDFNSHFTLYCPHEYEPDALYVFTPDLMALLIDNAGAFDVEIIDDWMFVYSATPFTMTDPRVLSRLFTIVGTVGAKTLKQTERYRDERMPSAGAGLGSSPSHGNDVAPAGRRLAYKRGWVGAAFFIAFALVWLWSLIGQR